MNKNIIYSYSLVEWIEISRKWFAFLFKKWCLDMSTTPKKDGPWLSGLPSSYNFNRHTSLLPQVPLTWQAPYIVSFYHQHILNFFTSLFICPLGKGIPHLTLDTSKNTFESASSPEFLPITRQILYSSIIKASKYKIQDTTHVIEKGDKL